MVSDAELINSHGNSLCYNYETGCISLITFFFFEFKYPLPFARFLKIGE